MSVRKLTGNSCACDPCTSCSVVKPKRRLTWGSCAWRKAAEKEEFVVAHACDGKTDDSGWPESAECGGSGERSGKGFRLLNNCGIGVVKGKPKYLLLIDEGKVRDGVDLGSGFGGVCGGLEERLATHSLRHRDINHR